MIINKEQFTKLLLSTKRVGLGKLLIWLTENGFFEMPASTKYHSSYSGGLMHHSYSVYRLFTEMLKKYDITWMVNDASAILCGLLHDVCKCGAYVRSGDGWVYTNNREHASLSLEILDRFTSLTPRERLIIKYHMGFYGSREFFSSWKPGCGEYDMSEVSKAFNFNKAVKLFHLCDDLSANFHEVYDVAV